MRAVLTLLFGGLTLGLVGCVGTDFIADPPPTFDPRLEITPSALALEQGDNAQLEATYFDMSGEAVADAPIAWETSDPSRASIDNSGALSALEPGQVMITAISNGVTSDPALVTIVADANQVARVTVEPDTVMLEPTDRSVFAASVFNLNGDRLNDKTVAWSSSDPAIATITDAGIAEGIAPGIVDIVATVEGVASMPSTLIVLGSNRTGTFERRPGTSYQLAGTALLQELVDGTLELSFSDDFSSSNGPNLAVYLSTTNRIGGSSIQLGELKSTSGAQTYSVPTNVTLDQYDWVIIHCIPFNVTFGYARLN